MWQNSLVDRTQCKHLQHKTQSSFPSVPLKALGRSLEFWFQDSIRNEIGRKVYSRQFLKTNLTYRMRLTFSKDVPNSKWVNCFLSDQSFYILFFPSQFSSFPQPDLTLASYYLSANVYSMAAIHPSLFNKQKGPPSQPLVCGAEESSLQWGGSGNRTRNLFLSFCPFTILWDPSVSLCSKKVVFEQWTSLKIDVF